MKRLEVLDNNRSKNKFFHSGSFNLQHAWSTLFGNPYITKYE